MNKGLRKELAVVSGLLAGVSLLRRSPKWTALFAAGAAGLYLSSTQNQPVKNKKVLITGGSRGLGLSLAWNALERGATDITLLARDERELLRAQNILIADFPWANIFINVCDVTESLELANSIDQAIERMDGVDLLINNAGSILVGPFTSMETEDFEAQMKLHLYAAVESTQFIFPHFKLRGGGRILNVCSLGGKVAVPHMLPYDASKFALSGFSQGVAAELAPHNICVTTAYPTVMRTGSPIQAVFKGDHEKEFEWFSTVDNLPWVSLSADSAAKKMLDAVEDGRTEVILSVPAKARLMIGAFLPETMNAVMGFIARLLPTADSSIRKTGNQSARLFRESFWLSPLRRRSEKVEAEYNQKPEHSAEFNLGLK